MTNPTLLSSTLNVLLSTLSVLGLKRSNESYRELNLALRLIPVIKFVPVDMLTVAFDQLFEELAKKANCLELEESINQKLNEIASSFEKSYIKGETICRNNRESLFPLNLWNGSKEAIGDLVVTTNAIEGWHCPISRKSSFSLCVPGPIKLFAANQKFIILKVMEEIPTTPVVRSTEK